MPKFTVEVIEHPQRTIVYGLAMPSCDRTLPTDIPMLSHQFYDAAGRQPGTVLPLYVISQGYNAKTKEMSLFVGGEEDEKGLQAFVLPAGTWAKMVIRPRFKVFWGGVVGNAKRYFYTRWLPRASYTALNMEYERHTAASTGQDPHAELFFALEPAEAPPLR